MTSSGGCVSVHWRLLSDDCVHEDRVEVLSMVQLVSSASDMCLWQLDRACRVGALLTTRREGGVHVEMQHMENIQTDVGLPKSQQQFWEAMHSSQQ
jgi:hypothetical protein